MLQCGIFGTCCMSVNRASRGNVEAGTESEGVESELQLLGRCSASRRTEEVAETDDNWIAAEEHKASDPSA